MSEVSYKDLVEYVIKFLVDNPDSIDIRELEGARSTIIELRVHKDDVGKIIGKHGRIAKAIRTIVSAAATKAGKRVHLEILD